MLDSIARHQALVDAVEGKRSWEWDIRSTWIDEVEYLTPDGQAVAYWAVSNLERFLGHNFLHKQGAVAVLWSSGLWPLFSTYPIPWDFANLVQFAAQIALPKLDIRRVGRKLRSNRTLEAWAHVQLQLDTACLGLMAGWEGQLEPQLPTGKVGDVCFVREQKRLFVEAHLRYPGKAEEFAHAFFIRMALFTSHLELQYSIHITGEIGEPLPARRVPQLCRRLEEAARATGQDGDERQVEDQESGLRLKVSGEVPAGTVRLESPVPSSGLDLLLECLGEKNDQYRGTGAPWIRVEERTGLWQFSELAYLSTEQRLDFLSSYLQDTLMSSPNLMGVILSPRLLLASQTPPNARCAMIEKASGIAVRRPIPGTRVRETVIIPREGHLTAVADAKLLASVYEKEDTLLDWLLARSGHPPFNVLVRDPK